jgi:triacylglycerol lipase
MLIMTNRQRLHGDPFGPFISAQSSSIFSAPSNSNKEHSMRTRTCTALALGLVLGLAPTALADDFTKTKYPIFLAEGLGGLDYFLIEEALEAGGAIVCDQPDDQVPHFAGSELRADALIPQIQACAQANGVTKVNLFGFSQGGEDARVVIKRRPDLLASVTTIGSPHRFSTGLADRSIACIAKQQLGVACAPDEQAAFDAFVALGPFAGDPDGPVPPPPSGVLHVLCQFSSGLNPLALATCVASGFDPGPVFDLKYPQGLPLTACGQGPEFIFGPAHQRIYLFSWGGTQLLTDPADPSDPRLVATGAFLQSPNDGLIERCSTHFGKVLRDDYPWNHLDLINQREGLTGPTDPTVTYREHANRLKGLGL